MPGRRLPALDPKEVVRALEKAGFVRWRQRGSHLTMFRGSDHRALTVPMHFSKNVPKGTLRAIIRDAGLSISQLLELTKAR